MQPPPRPLFVTEIIPKAIAELNETQERIISLTSSGAPIVQPELVRVLDLCKQILKPPQQ